MTANNEDFKYNKAIHTCEICSKKCKGYRGYISHKRWHNIPKYQELQKSYKNRMKEKNNPLWKGDDVSYEALHEWVRRYKTKPEQCVRCAKKTTKLDASNISGKYLRDLNDFEYLCKKCHRYKDQGKYNTEKKKLNIDWEKTILDISSIKKYLREKEVPYYHSINLRQIITKLNEEVKNRIYKAILRAKLNNRTLVESFDL